MAGRRYETVSVLCTDLEGSTRLRTSLGDADYDAFRSVHDDLVARSITQHQGNVVKSTGDGVLAWFSSARAALGAAIDIQNGLATLDADGSPLGGRLRIGLHVGEVHRQERDIYGEAVNAAARITAQAAGGEILVSQAMKDVAGTMPGLELVDRGAAALKGFPQPWRLFCVGWHAHPSRRAQVRLLGPIDVVDGEGRSAPVGGPKEQTVLAVLALAPGTAVSRDAIADALWGDALPASWDRTLRSYVSRLRRRLEPLDGIEIERVGDAYRLDCGPEGTDVLAVRARLDEGREALEAGEHDVAVRVLRDAEGAWRGPVLSGVATEHATLADVVRLDELRLTVLEHRVEAELRAGHEDSLVSELEALTRTYPLRERLWRARMLALYRQGRQAEALGAFREVRTLLGDELGLEPSEELRSLEVAILREDPSLRRPERGEAPSPGASDRLVSIPTGLARPPVLVGRDAELAELRGMLAETDPDTAQIAVLEGEAGVGKTALAAAFARDAHDAGATVLYGRCDEGLGYAYQPVAEALGPLLSGLPGEALAGLRGHAPELTRLWPPLKDAFPDVASPVRPDAEADRWAMFSAVASVLAIAARDGPVVLVVDDLHWGAPDAIHLLRHLARDPTDQRLLVVATFRGHDVDEGHAVAGLVTDLHRDLPGRRLALGGLEVDAVAALVGRATERSVDESTLRVAEILWEETSGNAFFVAEMLRHLLEIGGLSEADGGLTLVREDAPEGVPAGIRELLGRRLARLDPECRRILGRGAVIGPRFRLSLLEALSGPGDEVDPLDAVEEAVAAGLLVEHGTSFAFAHALVHHAVLAEIGAARRARLHRRIGEALEAAGSDDLDALAHQFCRAAEGDPALAPKAGQHALAAARGSIDRGSFSQAVAQAQQGLDALALLDDPDPALRVDLLIERSRAENIIVASHEERESSRERIEAAEEAALELGDPIRRARLAAATTGAPPAVGPGGRESRDRLAAAVEDLGDKDLVLRARLLARLGAAENAVGDHEASWRDVEEARRCAEESGDLLARADAAAAEARLLDTLGDRDRLLELAALLDEQPSTLAGGFRKAALVRRAVAWERGDLAGAEEAQRVLELEADRVPTPNAVFDVVTYRVLNHLARGEWDEAETGMADMLSTTLHPNVLATWGANQIALHRDTGRTSDILPTIEASVESDPDVSAFRAALALAHAELGDEEAAASGITEFVEARFRNVRRDSSYPITLCLLAETVVVLDARRAMRSLYPLVARYAGLAPSQVCTISLGAVDRFLGAMAGGLGRWADAEAHFQAAVELEEDLDATVYLARTRAAYARMLVRRGDSGDRDHARELLEAVLRETERLGMSLVHEEALALSRNLARSA